MSTPRPTRRPWPSQCLICRAWPPFFFVQLPYPGSTPEEVERNLVRPVEEALATMPGIKSMNANATADGGGVFVQFSDWSRDVAIAASEARERIDVVRDELPDDFRRYFVRRWSTGDQEAISLRLTSDDDLTARGDLIERSLKQRLERLPGVARVEVEGVPTEEVLIGGSSGISPVSARPIWRLLITRVPAGMRSGRQMTSNL